MLNIEHLNVCRVDENWRLKFIKVEKLFCSSEEVNYEE